MDGEVLDHSTLDPVLAGVIRDNRQEVVGWMRGEPGCWGFLAGKAVAVCRRRAGRPSSDGERRLVWSRLWWWLEQVREQALH